MNIREFYERGTGKTHRIVQEANEQARQGKEVCILCPNVKTVEYIKHKFDLEKGVKLRTIAQRMDGEKFNEMYLDNSTIPFLIDLIVRGMIKT